MEKTLEWCAESGGLVCMMSITTSQRAVASCLGVLACGGLCAGWWLAQLLSFLVPASTTNTTCVMGLHRRPGHLLPWITHVGSNLQMQDIHVLLGNSLVTPAGMQHQAQRTARSEQGCEFFFLTLDDTMLQTYLSTRYAQ